MNKVCIVIAALGLLAGCRPVSAAHPAQSSTFRTGALPAYSCCDGFYMPEMKPKRDKPKPEPTYDENRPGKPHEPHKEHGPDSAV